MLEGLLDRPRPHRPGDRHHPRVGHRPTSPARRCGDAFAPVRGPGDRHPRHDAAPPRRPGAPGARTTSWPGCAARSPSCRRSWRSESRRRTLVAAELARAGRARRARARRTQRDRRGRGAPAHRRHRAASPCELGDDPCVLTAVEQRTAGREADVTADGPPRPAAATGEPGRLGRHDVLVERAAHLQPPARPGGHRPGPGARHHRPRGAAGGRAQPGRGARRAVRRSSPGEAVRRPARRPATRRCVVVSAGGVAKRLDARRAGRRCGTAPRSSPSTTADRAGGRLPGARGRRRA